MTTYPTHRIDAVVTSDDWRQDRNEYTREGYEELRREETEATNQIEALADHLESTAVDICGVLMLLHLGADAREIEAELDALRARVMLLRAGLLAA